MNKLFKRSIAVLLSALMLITAMPFTAVTAFAEADDTAIYGELDAAIALYEEKMSKISENTSETGYVYSNMYDAYEAYCYACRLRDAYKYGNAAGADSSFASAASDLTTKTNAMTPWVYTRPSNANKFPHFISNKSNDYGTESYGGTLVDNIMYTTNITGTTKDNNNAAGYICQLDQGKIETAVYYPSLCVVLFDGVTQPKIPAMLSIKGTQSQYDTSDAKKDRYLLSLYPTINGTSTEERTDIYCINMSNNLDDGSGWKGGGAKAGGVHSSDFGYAQTNGQKVVGQDYANSVQGCSQAANNYTTKGDYRKIAYHSSALTINPDYSFPDANYVDFTNISWYRLTNSEGAGSWNKKEDGCNGWHTNRATGDSHIFALNYSVILKALKTARTTLIGTNVSNYKQGGLGAYMTAIDAAENYTIGSLDFSSSATNATTLESAVATAATNIKNTAKGITDITSFTEDTDYTTLKNVMVNPDISSSRTAKYKFNRVGAANVYRAETWAPFAAAYTVAQNYFATYNTTDGSAVQYPTTFSFSYADTVVVNPDTNESVTYPGATVTCNSIRELATYIKQAEDALVRKIPGVKLVNTEESLYLGYILDNAYYIVKNKSYFNQTSYNNSNVYKLATEAIEALYGSVDNYGDEAALIDDNAESQALVRSLVGPLKAAVEANQMNWDAVIPAMNYSLNSAIAEGLTYAPNRNDYANYTSGLEPAIDAAGVLKENYSGMCINATEQNAVKNLTDDYWKYTSNIIKAIRALRPAFDKMTNGAIAKLGTETTLSRSNNGNRWKLRWTRTNGIVYFKTDRASIGMEGGLPAWKLPYNQFEWETSEKYDAMLDTMNFSANPDLSYTEITAKSCGAIGNSMPSDYGLNQAQKDTYPGGMSIQNANITLSFENIKVTSSSAGNFAKGLDGSNIPDMNTDLTQLLLTTEGAEGTLKGGIIANKGTTKFGAVAKISVPATTGSNTKATTVTNRSKKFSASAAGAHFGYVYYYKYDPFLRWVGYTYDETTYDQQIYVVDLCSLFELIQQCEAMAPQANNYSKDSWDAFTQAISNAKAEIPNAIMSIENSSNFYDALLGELDARYIALWDILHDGLKAPADNSALRNAIEANRNTFNNDQANCSPDSWVAFDEAYRAALLAYNGRYSDVNIRQYSYDNEDVNAKIASLVKALEDAANGLARYVDFSPVDAAANALLQATANNTYTVESLNALKTRLQGFTNLNMSAAERRTHFTDETEFVANLTREIAAIQALVYDAEKENNVLTPYSGYLEALAAAKADLQSKYEDPDAYDIADITARLNTVEPYATVEFPSYTDNGTYSITGLKYANQDEINFAGRAALDGVSIQEYTVKAYATGNSSTPFYEETVPYGTEVTISADGMVDWYYKSTSNTTTSNEKLYSTGEEVTFVVKGNTELRTKKADSASVKKVKFVNSINGKAYDIKYVAENTVIDLSEEVANLPKFAYFGFSNFALSTVDNAIQTNSTITVTKDTTVYAVFDFASETDGKYNMTVFGVSPYIPVVFGQTTEAIAENVEMNGGEINSKLNYNTRVDFDDETYCYQGDEYFDLAYKVGGEDKVVEYMGRDINTSGDPYAWVKFTSETEDYLTIADAISNAYCLKYGTFSEKCIGEILDAVPDIEAEVIGYGADYSFYAHEEGIISVVGEDEFAALEAAGIITKDYTIDAADTVRDNGDGTFSIVSTYCVPQGADVIENGILFVAAKSAISDKLTLSEANTNARVRRYKSTAHTVANQYVITVNLNATGTVNLKYCAYVTYKLPNGDTVTAYSTARDGSFTK